MTDCISPDSYKANDTMSDLGNNWWCVQRHGGRRTDNWRTVIKGSEADCRRVYREERVILRQGSVELINPDGATVECTSAPRLRSRW